MSFKNNPQTPVFYQPTGKRWKHTRRVTFLTTVYFRFSSSFFLSVFSVTPFVPSFSIRAKSIVTQTNDQPVAAPENSAQNNGEYASNSPVWTQTTHPTTIGFYVNWDDTSYASLKRNIDKLDWFAPEWIRLQDGDQPLVTDFDDKALDLIHKEKPNMPIFAARSKLSERSLGIRTFSPAAGRHRDNPVQKLVNSLLKTVNDNKFAGLTVDLEEVPKTSQANLFTFMKELYAGVSRAGFDGRAGCAV